MNEQTEQSQKLTPLEKKWVLYDVANSAYVLLATALLSFYFNFVSPTGNLTSVWANTNVIVTVIAVFLPAPVLLVCWANHYYHF